jgi:hypothetical protein
MQNKLTFKQYLLQEAPIGDYKTIGNFDKSHSFRDRRDRTLITNPRSIQRLKNKFDNTDHDFNLFFVNMPGAGRHLEVGILKGGIEEVEQRLGKVVADEVRKSDLADSINVIFTNNSGSEKMVMTPWIIAHRIAHAFARVQGSRTNQPYLEASDVILRTTSEIMQNYYGMGASDFPASEREKDRARYGQETYKRSRNHELMMKNFFQKVCTFRSAREGIIRDWFEVINELFAQYITTGSIKFNAPPSEFAIGGYRGNKYRIKDADAVNEILGMLSRDLGFYFDDMLSAAYGKILIM